MSDPSPSSNAASVTPKRVPSPYELLAEATLAAIDAWAAPPFTRHDEASRERVASDLAGLQDHQARPERDDPTAVFCVLCVHRSHPCPDACRYAEGLRRTAALYGIHALPPVGAGSEPDRG